jgi:hypothetical protein
LSLQRVAGLDADADTEEAGGNESTTRTADWMDSMVGLTMTRCMLRKRKVVQQVSIKRSHDEKVACMAYISRKRVNSLYQTDEAAARPKRCGEVLSLLLLTLLLVGVACCPGAVAVSGQVPALQESFDDSFAGLLRNDEPGWEPMADVATDVA